MYATSASRLCRTIMIIFREAHGYLGPICDVNYYVLSRYAYLHLYVGIANYVTQ